LEKVAREVHEHLSGGGESGEG